MSRLTSGSFWLRVLILIMFVVLGAAVLYQSARQGFDALDSVSAYYYTPIRPVFVGSLVIMGACMAAIRARYGAENGMLKLAGMFAAVVATVPTARGPDIVSAARECDEGGGTMVSTPPGEDCVSEQVLRDAGADAGSISILVLSALVLVAFVALYLPRRNDSLQAWKSVGFAFLLLLAGVVVLEVRREWFIHNAHFVAAAGLFVCLLVLALARGLTHEERQALARRPLSWVKLLRILFNLEPRRYAWVAWTMLAGVVVMVPLWRFGVVTLFWLEIVIGALFVLFWLVQTTDRSDEPSQQAVPLAKVA